MPCFQPLPLAFVFCSEAAQSGAFGTVENGHGMQHGGYTDLLLPIMGKECRVGGDKNQHGNRSNIEKNQKTSEKNDILIYMSV